MFNKLIQPQITLENLFQLFTETVDIEPKAIQLQTETLIFKAIPQAFQELGIVDDGLTSSATLFLFFEKVNETCKIHFPDELIDSDLTFGILLSEINRMINENNIIRIRFDSHVLDICLQEWVPITVSNTALNGTTKVFIKEMSKEFPDSDDEPLTLFHCLKVVFHNLGLDITDQEINSFNELKDMTSVCQAIDKKVALRKSNDCRVKYGNVWSRGLKALTREYLTKNGIYPLGIRMKHISGTSYGRISDTGIMVNDKIVEVPAGHFCICTDKNLAIEFESLEALLAHGWAVD